MQITDEARDILLGVIQANGKDALLVTEKPSSCGHTSLLISLASRKETDLPVLINQVSVLMDAQVATRAETVTLSTRDGRLVILDDWIHDHGEDDNDGDEEDDGEPGTADA